MQDMLDDRSKSHQLGPVSTHDRTNVLERQLKDLLFSLYKKGELIEQVCTRKYGKLGRKDPECMGCQGCLKLGSHCRLLSMDFCL